MNIEQLTALRAQALVLRAQALALRAQALALRAQALALRAQALRPYYLLTININRIESLLNHKLTSSPHRELL